MPVALKARWRAWLQRHPRSDRWQLTQRTIYIVPTKAGVFFGFTLLLMLVATINYQLNLGYVLTFLLAGSGLSSLHFTHNNLRGLTLQLRPPAPGFAGEAAPLEVVLHNPGSVRHGIAISFQDRALRQHGAWIDVPAQSQAVARLSLIPSHRGLIEIGALRVETRFPLGLFRAWSVWRPQAQLLAWPRPERPPKPLPPAQTSAGAVERASVASGGEFDGVRAYRPGDALRHILWKKAARAGELISRDTHGSSSAELWLDWQQTQAADTEARLSRLCAWVLQAQSAGLPLGLRLPGIDIAPAQGEAHARRLLEALALWR